MIDHAYIVRCTNNRCPTRWAAKYRFDQLLPEVCRDCNGPVSKETVKGEEYVHVRWKISAQQHRYGKRD